MASEWETGFVARKKCPICKTKKPLTEFAPTSRGVHAYCNPCKAVYMRNWAADNPGARKEAQRRHWLKTYGVSEEQYDSMSAAGCMICGSTTRQLVLDHFHATNSCRGDGAEHTRGMLCSNCNSGIGMFQDNPGWLRAAASYLEENSYGR